MKNLFKYIGISSILLFSFYYTEKMSNVVINNSDLVSLINENSKDYNVEAVSAEIDGNYITPGLNGSHVNVLKSYNNMKMFETFNSYYLVYDKVLPLISLENNKNKIIKNGNPSKNAVAIIIKDNLEVLEYSIEKNINITRLVDINSYNKKATYEQINNDVNNFDDVEKLLNNNSINKNICYMSDIIDEICKEKEKYLVESTITLNNYNLSNIKSNVKSGYIIYIKDNVSLLDYKILIRQIYYQDLDIVNLSKLITEERD